MELVSCDRPLRPRHATAAPLLFPARLRKVQNYILSKIILSHFCNRGQTSGSSVSSLARNSTLLLVVGPPPSDKIQVYNFKIVFFIFHHCVGKQCISPAAVSTLVGLHFSIKTVGFWQQCFPSTRTFAHWRTFC